MRRSLLETSTLLSSEAERKRTTSYFRKFPKEVSLLMNLKTISISSILPLRKANFLIYGIRRLYGGTIEITEINTSEEEILYIKVNLDSNGFTERRSSLKKVVYEPPDNNDMNNN